MGLEDGKVKNLRQKILHKKLEMRMRDTLKKTIHCLIRAGLTLAAVPLAAETVALHTFQKIQLTDKFWSEAIAHGDLNRDGHADIVSGPYWYAGPGFKKRHVYASAAHTFKRKRADGAEETIEGYEGALGSGEVI